MLRRSPAPRPEPIGAREPAAREAAVAAGPASRTPFILLLLGLLGSGLICLLVVNTTLAAASFRIADLQKGNVKLAQQAQALQQQVATSQAPSTIERRAYRLGLRPQSVLNLVDLHSGRSYTSPVPAGEATTVPGYGP